MGESRYRSWGVESYGYVSTYKPENVTFRSNEDIYFDDFDNGLVSMQPMDRFMQDPYPLAQGVLHANFPIQRQRRTQYESPWSAADCFRKISPDRTSGSDHSSYDLHSPQVYHAGPYGSPTGSFSPSALPFQTTELFKDSAYPSHSPLLGGSVSLRQLEYEHHPEPVLETVQEGIHDVASVHEAGCEDKHTVIAKEAHSPTDSTDSGIGRSVRDAESVQPMDKQDFPEDPASDSDYKPISRSSKRRRSSASNSSPNRISKRTESSMSKSSTSGKVIKRSRRASNAAKKDIDIDDERRPFPCPLAAYGCVSTFSSKNEWKRHISTQHVKLGFWRCDLCAPSTDAKDNRTVYYNDFNRKDLFTQHLRRMHAAPKNEPSHSARDFPVNEDNLADHQSRCLLSLRKAPRHSSCLFCDKTFHGATSWEERIEHVGRHLEKDNRRSNDILDTRAWNKDEELERYLLDEGLIVWEHGEWRISDGKRVRRDYDSDDDSDHDE
ncbi:hypothetical protein BDU57DRAFT_560308 [Ampelomyces quisqualis]|uniref:C2H2-type domain-containing protein n=1 Tax=Ampelomyces quisqualis TaxID=50730 RepID=A0A6A5QBA7_AMPQU|nr:hypothetical protein BDU57DRAFT_560308 [Ampelomyces quisqualis]